MEKNKITQSAGTISANNLVVGDHAVINSSHQNLSFSKNDTAEISKMIDDLVLKIGASKETIQDKSDIISSIETLKTEVNKEKPSRITLMSMGKTILENLKYIKDIAPYAQTIWDKITALI